MFTRPTDLSDDEIAAALSDIWALHADDVSYVAVGFGSHHWHVTAQGDRWFATVDDLDMKLRTAGDTRDNASRRLTAALMVARTLHESGLEFVVAPVPGRSDEVSARISDRYVLALYPHVEGESHRWGEYSSRADRLAVVERLGAIHNVDRRSVGAAMQEDFVVPRGDELLVTITQPEASWESGPYGASAFRLLRQNVERLAAWLGRHDQLSRSAEQRPERWVLTHGEPYRANTINTVHGVVLIDWDTALVAPRERDLWALLGEDPATADDYSSLTGEPIDIEVIELYRLSWTLTEISVYGAQFHGPHEDTEDARVAWQALQECLVPQQVG